MNYTLPPLPTEVALTPRDSAESSVARPRICIIGYGRHGKDEMAAVLHGQGKLRYSGSTSWQALPFIARHIGQPQQIAWETRHECRQYWKDYCDILRKDDPCRLIKLALQTGNIVAGIRDKVEIEDAVGLGLFNDIVWVYRPGFPTDPTVTYDPAEFATDVIRNDGSLLEFRIKVMDWAARKGYL